MQDKDFAQRLARACDDSKIIPAYGQGRQVYIAKKLKVTQEAVRRWFTGDSRPRVKVMTRLSKLLEVDEAWLSLGLRPDFSREEKKVWNKRSEGVVYLSMGFAMIDGAALAVPREDDPRREYVDYYAIHDGVQTAVHNSHAHEVSDGVYELFIPHEYKNCRVFGFIIKPKTFFHVIDMSHTLINKHKKAKGGGYVVTVSSHGHSYITGRDVWPPMGRLVEEV